MAKSKSSLNVLQLSTMVVLRLATGWLLLYEGIGRVMYSNFSLSGYLAGSKGFLSGYFKSLAAQPGLMQTLNFVNEWGLIIIGLGLIFGLLVKFFSLSGMIFVLIGYLSHPPFMGLSYTSMVQGRYLIVDELFICFFLLAVFILFPTSHLIGIDRMIFGKK